MAMYSIACRVQYLVDTLNASCSALVISHAALKTVYNENEYRRRTYCLVLYGLSHTNMVIICRHIYLFCLADLSACLYVCLCILYIFSRLAFIRSALWFPLWKLRVFFCSIRLSSVLFCSFFYLLSASPVSLVEFYTQSQQLFPFFHSLFGSLICPF